MVSIIKKSIRILCIPLFSLLFFSCGENYGLNEDTYLFADDGKEWVDFDSLDFNFLMSDSNKISYGFSMVDSSYYFGKSWGGILGITTHISHTEYQYYSFSSTYGMNLNMSLTAGFPPYGDHLRVELGSVSFSYDLGYETLSRIGVFQLHKSMSMSDEGYVENDTILSRAEILYNYEIGSKVYDEVLRFELLDFTEELYKYTPKEIYVSKGDGLVKYVFNSGLEVFR